MQTADRGYGVQATAPIASGSLVIEYCGEVISHDECYRRLSEYDLLGVHDFYMMELSSSLMIDARQTGNAARFINHSCAPNCGTQVWTVGSAQRVGIFALRDIEPGEEVTYNYRAQTFNARGQHNGVVQACRCGAANCSSFLGEKPTAAAKREGKKHTKRKRPAAYSTNDERNGSKRSDRKVEHASVPAPRRRADFFAYNGQSRLGEKKSTGFGHAGNMLHAIDGEKAEDAVADGAAVKVRHEQQHQRSEEQHEVDDAMAVVKYECTAIEEETELDTSTSTLSAPASPSSSTSVLSSSSLDAPDFESPTVAFAPVKPSIADSAAAPFVCGLSSAAAVNVESSSVR